ncbi:MAG: metalloregulator ArsR/SmtB family transcription factor [bacterium]
MNKKTKNLFDARAKIIKALAHPTRLFIVDTLSKSELCVQDLTKLVGADISTVSKHLSILKESGIIEDEKRGLQVWYSLRTPCVMNFFGCIESVIESNALQQINLVSRK